MNNESEVQGLAEASKSKAWMFSIQEELTILINEQIWNLVKLPSGRKTHCDWKSSAKKESRRLVAKRHFPKPGIDITTLLPLLQAN